MYQATKIAARGRDGDSTASDVLCGRGKWAESYCTCASRQQRPRSHSPSSLVARSCSSSPVFIVVVAVRRSSLAICRHVVVVVVERSLATAIARRARIVAIVVDRANSPTSSPSRCVKLSVALAVVVRCCRCRCLPAAETRARMCSPATRRTALHDERTGERASERLRRVRTFSSVVADHRMRDQRRRRREHLMVIIIMIMIPSARVD